ncbi:anti-sigma factor, partial [Staphylococcus sp. GSSP0090]|nr:anti-sigma factor [Staphylococcus sp. GSSP0090]
MSSESKETLDSINILHQTLPYSNKEVDPPTGMKERILESVLNEENGADTNSEVEKQQDKEDDNHLTAAQSYRSGMGDSSETHQYKKLTTSPKQNDDKKPKIPLLRRISIGIMAALLLLSLIGNGVQYFKQKESQNQPTPMINTNNAQSINLKSMDEDKTQGQAYVSSNKTHSKLMVEANDIEATKGNEVYQVWVIKDNKPYPTGAFATKNDKGMVVFDLSDMDIDENDTIALTLEPSPNNNEPKGQMIMASKEI